MHTRTEVVPGWPVLADGGSLGAVTGVGVDSRDRLFAFHRAGRVWRDVDGFDLSPIPHSTVAVFDGSSGIEVEAWGEGIFAMPHGLTIDHEDNVWLTDVALQQIFKFSPGGQLLLTVGERGIAGEDTAHFNQPTKVAVAMDGSFYVSDGYGNSRVMKFAPDGRFLFAWGSKGSGEGQFDLPHAIALDSAGRVYVVDRSNVRVQIFDAGGRFIGQWTGAALGQPFDIAFGADGTAFLADGGDALVVVGPDGSVTERVGRSGDDDGEFRGAHDVAVARDGSIYAGEIDGRRVQKFSRITACPPESSPSNPSSSTSAAVS